MTLLRLGPDAHAERKGTTTLRHEKAMFRRITRTIEPNRLRQKQKSFTLKSFRCEPGNLSWIPPAIVTG